MKKVLIAVMFAVLIAGFAIAADNAGLGNNADDEDKSSKSPCYSYVGGTKYECCLNEGYSGWDQEELKCIGHKLNSTQIAKIKGNHNKIDSSFNQSNCPSNCTCSGSVTKCWLNGTRVMTIAAGKSGNIIIQVKGINASTNVTLYKSDGKLYGEFKNNKTKRIMTPEQIEEKIKEKNQVKWEEHNITLDENGYYQMQSKKKARLFLIIPVREKVKTQIDAETGEIIKLRNPWWDFWLTM